MDKVAVRRINEWDGPAMLKIYHPYVENTLATFETEPPELQSYIRRIDKYTYGYGWIMCEINNTPAGFCHLTELPEDPENLFVAGLQIYVKEECKRRGVGKALIALMTDIMQFGNKKELWVRFMLPNDAAVAFFTAAGFEKVRTDSAAGRKFGREHDVLVMRKQLTPQDPDAERPIKPYLIENYDYEAAREQAALLVKQNQQ